MNTTATAADLNTHTQAAAKAIETIGALTEIELVVGDSAGADHSAPGMGSAMVLRASGPTGSVVVGFSESIAQLLAEKAGASSEDPDEAWTELSRVGLAGAEAFVAAVSQAGVLVGPVGEIAPVDTLAIDAEGPLSGVEVSVTAGDVEGRIWLLLPAPVQEARDVQAAHEPEPQIETIEHPELGEGVSVTTQPSEISLLSDVSMEVTVELGRTVMRVREVLELSEGSVVELTQPVGAHVNVLINGSSVALGEVVVIDDVLGVRITSVTAESN